jgi:hypothetical protein
MMSFEGQASSMTDKQTSANDSILASSSHVDDDSTNRPPATAKDVEENRRLGKKQQFMV